MTSHRRNLRRFRSSFLTAAVLIAGVLVRPVRAEEPSSFMVIESNAICRVKPAPSAAVVRRLRLGEVIQVSASLQQEGGRWLSVVFVDGTSEKTCWSSASAIRFDPVKPENALVILAYQAAKRKDKGRFEDYATVDRILASKVYAAALASSGLLQFRRLQVIDRAVSSWDATREAVEKEPAKKAWITEREQMLSYFEPGGSWYVPGEMFWKLYEPNKTAPWADELAWTAAQHSPPTDECMTDCVLDAKIIQGPLRYWIRFPHGGYVKEALRGAVEMATYAAGMACGDRDLASPGIPSDSPAPSELLEKIRSSVSELTAPEKRDLLSQLDEAERRCTDYMPRRGITRTEAEREFGQPVQTSTRREGVLTVETAVFVDAARRISMDFVEGILVRYTILPQ